MNLFTSTSILRTCTVLSVVGFLYASGIAIQYHRDNQALINKGIQAARQLGHKEQTRISHDLRRVTETIDKASDALVQNVREDPRNLLAVIRNIMYSDPGFVEAGVAFAPFAYDPDIRLYGISYVVKEDSMRLRDVDSSEDYTKPEAAWYHRAMEGKAVWLEPKYDETRHEMLVTYAAPIYKPRGSAEPAGVVFATYSLNGFKNLIDNMALGDNGYGFLLSSTRRFIVHHNQEYIDHQWTLDDILARLKDTSTINRVNNALLDTSRIVNVTDPDSGQGSQVMFFHIPEAGWTLGILLNDKDLTMPSSVARIKLLHIVLALCFAIVLLTIPLSGVRHGTKRSFWILSNVFTVCCIISYVFALKLTVDYPPENTANSHLITNQNILNHFMSNQRHRTMDQREELPLFIPTGLYIQSISFDSSIGGIAINGYIWQRYTLGIHDNIDREIVIPGSDSFELEKPLVTRSGNTELVRWGFKGTLYQDFNFSKYPFVREYVQIHLRHKQFTRNIILVPDLESYKLVNPSAWPGLQPDIFLHGWNIDKSYFNYRYENYSTSFGLTDYAGLTDFPELYFTIEISKQIFGAVISHALPLAVVSLLLFALLLLSTNMEVGKLEVVEAIAACAGFFLVIVFAHIGLRQSFAVQDIIYLEYYYYVTYVLILFTVVIYVIIASHKQKDRYAFTDEMTGASPLVKLIRVHDNLLIKVLYWPLSQLAVLVLTLWTFY